MRKRSTPFVEKACPRRNFTKNTLPFSRQTLQPTAHARSPRHVPAASSVASPPSSSPRGLPATFSPSSRLFSLSAPGSQEGRDPLFFKARDLPSPPAGLPRAPRIAQATAPWSSWELAGSARVSARRCSSPARTGPTTHPTARCAPSARATRSTASPPRNAPQLQGSLAAAACLRLVFAHQHPEDSALALHPAKEYEWHRFVLL